MLDRQRLGKQRVEAYQILQVLFGIKTGWVGHPAVEMWRGYELALGVYANHMCIEWCKRGYEDNMKERVIALVEEHLIVEERLRHQFPLWLGYPKVHATHRKMLYEKDPEHYGPFNRAEADLMATPCCEGCNYYWPTHTNEWVAAMKRRAA